MASNDRTRGIKAGTGKLPRSARSGIEGARPEQAAAHDGADPDPERKCVLSGAHGARAALIRLALAPDGTVAPDIRARAPGRGAWIAVDKATLQAAIAKGKLKGALARAFKTSKLLIPDDLPDQIEAALQRATLDRLGLEARAGALVTGAERISDAARKGTVALMLHARDAAVDGSRKLDQALRVGLGIEGSGEKGVVIPASRAILSMALGRENVVHAALIAPAAAARVSEALSRWRSFIGWNDDTGPCEMVSQGSAAVDQ